jgi:predicted Zn-dependent peptidase
VVAVGADNRKASIVLEAVLAEFRRLAREPIGDAELKKARDHFIGNFTMGLETSNSLASFYGFQEIGYRDLHSPREFIAKLRAVTAKDIQTAAKAIFRNDRLNLAVIGPYRSGATFKKLLKL